MTAVDVTGELPAAAPVGAGSVETGSVGAAHRLATDAGRRRLVLALSIVYALLACSLSVTAALPELRRVVPMSDVVTSLHGSFFGWALLVGGLWGHGVVRRVGRGRLVVGSVVALGVGTLVFATARSAVQSLGGAAVIGIAGATLIVAIPALVADVYGAERGAVFNRINTAPALTGFAFPLALTAAPALGWSWRWPTAVLPALCVAAFAIVAAGLRPAPRPSGPRTVTTEAPLRPLRLLRIPALRRRAILQTVSIAMEFGAGVWVVTFLREEAGFSATTAPLGAAAWAVGMFVSRSLVPRMVAVLRARLELFCFVLATAASSVLVLAPWGPVRLAAAAVTAFAVGPLYTLGVDRLFVLGTDGTDGADAAADPSRGGAVSALAAVSSGVAITAGPFLVGLLADLVGLRTAMGIIPVTAAIGAAVVARRWGGEAGLLGR